MYDEEGRNVEEWVKASFVEYNLSDIDKNSIIEIKKMLTGNMYKDEDTVLSHLEYLEHLANRIDSVMTEEGDLARNDVVLMRVQRTIKGLQNALTGKLGLFDNI